MTRLPKLETEASQPERLPTYLRRSDQQTVAVLVLMAGIAVAASMTWFALKNGGVRAVDEREGRAVPFRVDINTADWPELAALPQIGKKTAQAIVRHRSQYGPYSSVSSLMDVSGIGPKTIQIIRPYLLPVSEEDDGEPSTEEFP